MGQKVNPIGLRLGINRTWDSRWYAGKKDFGRLLQEDIKIREYLSDKLKAAGVNDATLHRILVDNSRRFLAFVPKRARHDHGA